MIFGNEVTTVCQFGGGIKITNIAKKYDKYDAYEWVNYIENTSDKPSEIISDLWDCDCTLPLKHEALNMRKTKNIVHIIPIPKTPQRYTHRQALYGARRSLAVILIQYIATAELTIYAPGIQRNIPLPAAVRARKEHRSSMFTRTARVIF